MTHDVTSRVMEDFIAQERRARELAEKETADYLGLLSEIAMRLDGVRFEAMRKKDPRVPKAWNVDDWRDYLAPLIARSMVTSGQVWGTVTTEASAPRKEDLAIIEDLRKKLGEAQALLAIAQHTKEEQTQGSSDTPARQPEKARDLTQTGAQGNQYKSKPAHQAMRVTAQNAVETVKVEITVPPYMELLDITRDLLANPMPLPGDKKYEDLRKDPQRPWHKYYAVISMVGKYGLSAVMEMSQLISDAYGGKPKPSSSPVRKVFDNLIEYRYLAGNTYASGAGTSALLLHFTPEGAVLYKDVTGQAPVESEWERMVRLHRGSEDTAHAAGCIIFGLQARWLGYKTVLLPEVNGPARPDLSVEKDGKRLMVEVELGTKEHVAKWRNLASLNDGQVAICAATAQSRERLMGDCTLAKIPGVATDLERFKAVKYGEDDHGALLWTYRWS